MEKYDPKGKVVAIEPPVRDVRLSGRGIVVAIAAPGWKSAYDFVIGEWADEEGNILALVDWQDSDPPVWRVISSVEWKKALEEQLLQEQNFLFQLLHFP